MPGAPDMHLALLRPTKVHVFIVSSCRMKDIGSPLEFPQQPLL